MLSWDDVSLHLRALGYLPVTFLEIDCSCCNRCFRLAVEKIQDGDTIIRRWPCPGCGAMQPATILATGYSRRVLPLIERVPSRHLSAVSRAKLLESVGIRPEAPPKRKKSTNPGPRLPVLN